ncbi:hypothetical protein [Streptomyces sp. TRM68367]|nr:hypothetical protein [Streptomyces sp. TRM68367]
MTSPHQGAADRYGDRGPEHAVPGGEITEEMINNAKQIKDITGQS